MDTINGTIAPVSPAVGDTVRIYDRNGDIVGGGRVLAVDFIRAIVEQHYTHHHNGVIVEQGITEARYSLAGYVFERMV